MTKSITLTVLPVIKGRRQLGDYKTHRSLGGLKNRHTFCTVLEAGQSKVDVLATSVLGEDSLPCLQTAAFCLGAHVAFLVCVCVWGDGQRLNPGGSPLVWTRISS